MRRILSVVAALLLTGVGAWGQLSFGNATLFNEGWSFRLEPQEQWREVSIPHDWSVEGRLSEDLASCTGYLPGGIGWYRKVFTAGDPGLRHYIYFEGIYNRSEVYLNGELLGVRPNGFVSFMYDMTPYLRPGENELLVRVDHSRYADSRWYTGSGIYRDVWLVSAARTHFAPWGAACRLSQLRGRKALLDIDYALESHGTALRDAVVKVSVLDGRGRRVAGKKVRLEEGQEGGKVQLRLRRAKLWSLDNPYLYQVRQYLVDGGEVIDSCSFKTGLRTVRFDPDKGLAINGRSVKIKGVCLHHDAGVLGAVVPRDVWLRRLLTLRDTIGVNAIRTSHNPQAPVLYELCDSLGLMVMDEISDEWEFPKRKWLEGWNVGTPGFDGAYDFFEQWIETDAADMVRRDRNHPSIIMWSIGNEVDYPNDPYSHPVLDSVSITQHNFGGYDPDAPSAMRIGLIAERLSAVVRREDPSRPVTGALAGVVMSNETAYPDAVDLVGYNYTEGRYDEDHARYPQRVIYGSENRHDYPAWRAAADREFIAGQFLWTGIDYLGESRKWPSRGFGSGLLDFGGFPKPVGRFRQALWSGRPFTYIGTSTKPGASMYARDVWNYESGEEVTVSCYTNAPFARLLLDGETVGEMTPFDEKWGVISWTVPYAPGVLRAEGCDASGAVLSSWEITTAGDAVQLRAKPDKEVFETPRSVVHITVDVLDAAGVRVMTSTDEITCTVEGPARLLGLEGSDNADMSDYRDNRQCAHYGRLLAYIQPTGEAGEITARFSARGLSPSKVTLYGPGTQVKAGAEAPGEGQYSSIFRAYPEPDGAETPAPRGYEPFYISHYGRHGSRYQTSDERYRGVLAALEREGTAGNLTTYGEDVLGRMRMLWEEVRGHGGQLSSVGVRQHHDIARRMAGRWPQVLHEGAVINARSSIVQRCQDSMDAFLESLGSSCPPLKISRQADSADMAVLVPHDPAIDSLNAEHASWKYGWWSDYRMEVMHPERLMTDIFKDPSQLEPYAIEFMQAIYYLAAGQQDIPSRVDLSDILNPDEMEGCWKAINARMYYANCNCPLTAGIGPRSARPLLADFLQRARSAVAGTLEEDVTLRFGHDTNLIRLLSLMDVEGCSASESDFRLFHDVWKDWAVSPMAANLQVCLYRNRRGRVLVKLLLNENEVSIPALGKGPYYPWDAVEGYWAAKLSDAADTSASVQE